MATENTTSQELFSHLFEACNILRGPINQDEYKSYVTPIALAIIVYRRFESERKSTFWEIIIMVVEAIAISFLVWLMKWTNAFSTVLVVLFVETTIYSINIFIGYCIVLACNEDVYEYINSIKGLDGF